MRIRHDDGVIEWETERKIDKRLRFSKYPFLIVPLWHASQAYQVNVDEPWRAQTNPTSRGSEPRRVRLDIYRNKIRLSELDIVVMSGQWLDIAGYQDTTHGSLLADSALGYGKLDYQSRQVALETVSIVQTTLWLSRLSLSSMLYTSSFSVSFLLVNWQSSNMPGSGW